MRRQKLGWTLPVAPDLGPLPEGTVRDLTDTPQVIKRSVSGAKLWNITVYCTIRPRPHTPLKLT